MKLVLSEEYPNVPPRGFFLTKIYHPNVADNGDICVNTLKRDWSAELTLKHVFQVIKCLMIVPFPESSLNCEAGEQNQSQRYTNYSLQKKQVMKDAILDA